jgi:hypothetical protein
VQIVVLDWKYNNLTLFRSLSLVSIVQRSLEICFNYIFSYTSVFFYIPSITEIFLVLNLAWNYLRSYKYHQQSKSQLLYANIWTFTCYVLLWIKKFAIFISHIIITNVMTFEEKYHFLWEKYWLFKVLRTNSGFLWYTAWSRFLCWVLRLSMPTHCSQAFQIFLALQALFLIFVTPPYHIAYDLLNILRTDFLSNITIGLITLKLSFMGYFFLICFRNMYTNFVHIQWPHLKCPTTLVEGKGKPRWRVLWI